MAAQCLHLAPCIPPPHALQPRASGVAHVINLTCHFSHLMQQTGFIAPHPYSSNSTVCCLRLRPPCKRGSFHLWLPRSPAGLVISSQLSSLSYLSLLSRHATVLVSTFILCHFVVSSFSCPLAITQLEVTVGVFDQPLSSHCQLYQHLQDISVVAGGRRTAFIHQLILPSCVMFQTDRPRRMYLSIYHQLPSQNIQLHAASLAL